MHQRALLPPSVRRASLSEALQCSCRSAKGEDSAGGEGGEEGGRVAAQQRHHFNTCTRQLCVVEKRWPLGGERCRGGPVRQIGRPAHGRRGCWGRGSCTLRQEIRLEKRVREGGGGGTCTSQPPPPPAYRPATSKPGMGKAADHSCTRRATSASLALLRMPTCGARGLCVVTVILILCACVCACVLVGGGAQKGGARLHPPLPQSP